MGNYPTKNTETNLSSDEIKSNIRNLFKFNKNNQDSENFTDTIGWNNVQFGGKDFVSLKRYEQYKPSVYLSGGGLQTSYDQNLNQNKINTINADTEIFSQLSTDNTTKSTNINQLNNKNTSNTLSKDSTGYNNDSMTDISEINKLKDNILGNNEQNYKELSSDMSEIENLKNLIKKQIGGCGCESNGINMHALKGGAKSNKDNQDNKDNKKNNKNNKNNKDNKKESQESDIFDEEEIDDEIDEDNVEDEDEDEDLGEDDIDEENEEDEEEDGESNMARMTYDTDDETTPSNNIINAVPFYSSDSMTASSYFKNLNRNK